MLESKKIAAVARRITCSGCGTVFGCSLSEECWCSDSDYRLPVPDAAAEDCLCPDCMRKKALKVQLPKA
jgi:hypothetical protein